MPPRTFPGSGGGRYKWAVVGMLWFVCFFNYADRQAIFSVFPLLKRELGLSDVQLGVVAAAFMWVYALMAPLAGLVGDRFSRKTLILGGLVFWSAVTAATGFADSYAELVLFRALEGLGEAFYFPASMSLISDYHGPATRSRAMALHQSSVYAGTIAGGGFSGMMAEAYGWRLGFFVFGGLGVLLGLVLLGLLREPRRGADGGAAQTDVDVHAHAAIDLRRAGLGAELWALLSSRLVWMLIAAFVGANFVAMIFLTWMPSFLREKFGMSLSMAGWSATAYLQMASVLGVITGGVLADRLARRHAGGRILTQAVGLLVGAPFIFLAGSTLSVPVLVLAMAAFGFAKGLYDANIWAALYDVVRPERRATALGVMNAIGWLGGSAAPVAIALAAQAYGMSAGLSASAGVYVIVGLVLLLAARLRARRPGPDGALRVGVLKVRAAR